MKYPKLEGICATAIKNNLCTGCSRLELPEFKGLRECKYAQKPIQQIKEILRIQEAINDRRNDNKNMEKWKNGSTSR